MTIALGAICVGGIIVAADTNVVLEDGSKTQGCKVATALSTTGSYVIANASMDGNAAKTLVAHLVSDLENNELESLRDVEGIVADRMTQWASAHTKSPSVQLVLAAKVARETTADFPDERGLALYFCEPPNTVLRKLALDDSRGYVAVGTGAAVTDPLYMMLYSSALKIPRKRLIEISYLMYRAKKDSAFCGGRTNAVWLPSENIPPVWIKPPDMEKAEALGPTLDFLLNGTAAAVQQHTEESIRSYVGSLGDMLVNVGASFRELTFHSLEGKEI